ncbi:hypothetical protein [Microbulbifer sp. SAOS-129_SWC]|uniref:hypothetical protein n=1 Tax=Microbulbifer sp. SAOS-129_SWC TaxID=3145235 RepID=UPI0032176BB9
MKIFTLAFSLLVLTSFFSASSAIVGEGPVVVVYGFPIPWHARGVAFSLEDFVFVGPLFISFLIFLGVSFLTLTYSFKVYENEIQKRHKSFEFVFWSVCGFSSILGLLPFIADKVYFSWWFYPGLRFMGYLDGGVA